MSIILAIDPGLTGAIATSEGLVIDLPVEEIGKGNRKVKNRIDVDKLYAAVYTMMKDRDEVIVYLEEQIYRPRINYKTKEQIPQGGASIFSLGDTYGRINSVLRLARPTRIEEVLPAKWKKALKLTSDKEECRAKAIELFPQSHEALKRKKDHNRAEALLLAHYGTLMES